MSTAQLGVWGSAKVCAIRVARLGDDCAPVVGPLNAVATAAIVKVDADPQYENGQEYLLKDGNGDITLYLKDTDRLKDMKFGLELATRDFDLLELLTGGTLIVGPSVVVTDGNITSGSTAFSSATLNLTSANVGDSISGIGIPSSTTIATVTGAHTGTLSANATATSTTTTITTAGGHTIGIQRRGVGSAPQSFVSVELWTKTIDSTGVCNSGNEHWYRVIFPRVSFSLGKSTYENAIAMVMLEGFGTNNPQWGNGPFNDYPGIGTLATHTTEAWVLDTVGPPTLQDGYITVPAQT